MIQFSRSEIVREMDSFYFHSDIMYTFALMTDQEILTYYQTTFKDDKRKKSN